MTDVIGAPQTPTAPALGISIQCAAGSSQLVFQTHVAQDTGKEELDRMVDLLTSVADRQKAKADLVELKANRKTQMIQLENLVKDRGRLDEQATQSSADGRRTPKVPENEKRAREQSVVMEGKLRDVLARFDEDIAAAEAVVAGK